MQRLTQVAALLHCLNPENLLHVERYLEFDGIHVMVMQWIDGYDLKYLIYPDRVDSLRECVDDERWKRLDSVFTVLDDGRVCIQPGFAVNIIDKCLRGLDVLHSSQVVHCDIKPSNIMLDSLGSIRIIDIGSACELSRPPQHRAWTPRYAPPEVLEDLDNHDAWTSAGDLASLGYVLVELLSGQSIVPDPQPNDDSAVLVNPKRAKELIKAKLELPDRLIDMLPAKAQESERLVKLCQRLIHPDPTRRFQSAIEAKVGPDGAFTFIQELSKNDLVVSFSQEIMQWVKDVQQAAG